MRITRRLIGIALMARSIGLPVMATAGGFVIRDRQGRRTGTIEPRSNGSFVIRDQRGSRTGTLVPR